jgi:hypothetical protein
LPQNSLPVRHGRTGSAGAGRDGIVCLRISRRRREGELIECDGEIMRAGGSLIFRPGC